MAQHNHKTFSSIIQNSSKVASMAQGSFMRIDWLYQSFDQLQVPIFGNSLFSLLYKIYLMSWSDSTTGRALALHATDPASHFPI